MSVAEKESQVYQRGQHSKILHNMVLCLSQFPLDHKSCQTKVLFTSKTMSHFHPFVAKVNVCVPKTE